jgi:polyribonucleotide nucleotidyltransferase
MGLVIESEKKFTVLTDILGFEDGYGDMDFKVAGTQEGITALQLDVKTLNLTFPILKSALEEAKKARVKILKVMLKAIDKPRAKVSPHAPKIKVVKIPQEKIGEVIGPGGRVIRGIIEETGAQVDVDDDGSVNISAETDEKLKAAVEKVEALVKEVEADEIYEGEVKRIQPYGAFVEILPGKDGLVHISDMSSEYVNDPNEIVKIGDKVDVRVKEIDDMGRINLSMLLDKKDEEKKNLRRKSGEKFDRNRGRQSSGRGRQSSGKGRRPMGYGGRDDRKSSGPHFPASRLLNKKDFSR